MPKFGQLINGKWLNVHEAASLNAYKAFKVVPDNEAQQCPDIDTNGQPTMHGATDNGNGTCTNQLPPPSPAPVKRTCTRDEVIDLLPSGVMKACRDSTNAAVIKAFYKFLAKGGFTYAEGVVLADGLEQLTIITVQQNIDFKAAWPVA